jgi:hypothetical protein
MKKIFSVILLFILTLTLNSCMGKQDVPTTENDSKNNSGTVVIKE